MPSADQWGRDFERRPGWTTLKACVAATLIVLVIVAIVGLATTGSVFFEGASAKLTNPSRVKAKIYDPNNTTAQIAFFHDTCQRVNAQLRIYENNKARYDADRKAAKYASDPITRQQAIEQLSGDETDVTGALNAAQAAAADYNSRSRQSIANVFKGTGLPDQINLPAEIPAGYTIDCG